MAAAVRSVALSLMERGGLIRKIESLGTKELPYRMKAHAQIFTTGRYACVFRGESVCVCIGGGGHHDMVFRCVGVVWVGETK